MRLASRCAAAVLALAAAAAPAAAQQGESGAFVVTIGRDTLAVERFTRTDQQVTGEIVARSPATVQRTYTATLRPDGTVERFETTARPAAGGPATRATIEFGADSATWTFVRNDSTRTGKVAAAGAAFPLVNFSYALYERAIARARAAGADSFAVALVAPGAAQAFALTLKDEGNGRWRVANQAGTSHATVDEAGRLQRFDGTGSTFQVTVERVASVDLAGLASAFVARDAAGRGVGPLSPRDSAVAEVGGARVAVDYGRPFKRGRQIMGSVVPWNEVWRTGANAATGFRTTRDLEIRGVTVPAGAYTLWTLPSPTGWKLIINKQTGQWGTDYNEAQDLARVDMDVRKTAEPVEQFTIALDPSGTGGVLRISWDDTEASVPFTVK